MNKTAAQMARDEARFLMICRSAVAEAMQQTSDWLGEIELRDVHDVALEAATLALKRAFDGDAELTMLRIERDHYKSVALQFITAAGPTPIWLQPPPN